MTAGPGTGPDRERPLADARLAHWQRTVVRTVRHPGDARYGAGTGHGDDIREHGGFAVHVLPRERVDALAGDRPSTAVRPFEEGEPPRRLRRITQETPR
ncbi:hypothetical protein [Kitasatospora sp. NPDC018619]|uniref:hypothetical protein n=1 Tax=unclassified Kitasatospora TaxID=2633591 RepID=UPI00378F1D24